MKPWGKWLLLGLVSVGFGVIALGNTVAASMAVTTVTGLLLLITGGVQIAAGVTGDTLGHRIFAIALGLLMTFLGLSFLFNPLEGAISLAAVVMILLAASGSVRIVFAWWMRSTTFFWPMLISGALSVLLAAFIWANFATASVRILGILLGVELLFNGAGLIVVALFLRMLGRSPER